MVDARVQAAVSPQRQAVAELGQADEHQREQRAAVPLVVEQDVQVVERVLVQQVRLVEQEDGVEVVAAEVLDVGADREEERGGGRRGREAEREAELAVEVAAAERGVVAVGQAEAGLGQALAQRAQHAGLADAGLAGEQHRGALAERLDELVDDGLLRGRQPEVGVGDLLGEGRGLEAEVGEVLGGHHWASSFRLAGRRPQARSSRVCGGLKPVGGAGLASRVVGAPREDA